MFWRIAVCTFVMTGLYVGWTDAATLNRTAYDELVTVMDSARALEAQVFAPRTWEKAARAAERARNALEEGRRQARLDEYVSEAREYTENALEATEVCKLSLQEFLEPRNLAKKAAAAEHVPELYEKAEEQFLKATANVESGNVKKALKEAAKAVPLFNEAEIQAIRVDILGGADRMMAKAVEDGAEKYALSTLSKARAARDKADAIITADRYAREDAEAEANRAEYESRHAIEIATSVRSLKRNNQAWEKLILVYETQMDRVAEHAGFGYLPFDQGPLAAADSLIRVINNMQSHNEELQQKLAAVASQLQATAAQLAVDTGKAETIVLAAAVDRKVSELLAQSDRLAQKVLEGEQQLVNLSEEHQEVSAELEVRRQREEKFKKAKTLLDPSEGEVLFNASNDIVLRLSGLSFDVGKHDIKENHMPLLEKVKQVIELFPKTELVVEGHTDASGDPAGNMALSERRAFAVMQYLREALLIPAGRIKSFGYGSDRPVASNKTPEGRAKNRRIDVIIMP